jgi:4a-hydroxytetrahydrobiopterin dehydratase
MSKLETRGTWFFKLSNQQFVASSLFFKKPIIMNESMAIPQTWQVVNQSLYKKFIFFNFSEAFAFMTRVALAAEKADHHPTWTNTWQTVEIWLQTHDAGNRITEKDIQLAENIDQLVARQ